MKKFNVDIINNIKHFKYKIYDEEVKSQTDKDKIQNYKYLLNLGLKQYTKEEKAELLDTINWSTDNCIEKLENKGWKLVK